MWRVIESTWANLSTYTDLRPDFGLRFQLNRRLGERSPLKGDEWFERFWRHRGVSRSVADFVYTYLVNYSGLCWARVVPGDRLVEDLQLPLVCWFDWELELCEDFERELGVVLPEPVDLDEMVTVEDLLLTLNATAQGLSVA